MNQVKKVLRRLYREEWNENELVVMSLMVKERYITKVQNGHNPKDVVMVHWRKRMSFLFCL